MIIFQSPYFVQNELCINKTPIFIPSEGLMRAPRIIIWTRDYFCSYRIKVDVADQLQKIAVFVAKNRFVSPLKKMSDTLFFLVEIKSITLLNPLHEFRKRSLA